MKKIKASSLKPRNLAVPQLMLKSGAGIHDKTFKAKRRKLRQELNKDLLKEAF